MIARAPLIALRFALILGGLAMAAYFARHRGPAAAQPVR